MKAVILAGGFGTRLKSVNKNIPKPMTLICNKPVLEHQIEFFKNAGIYDFILVTGYLFEQIEAHFQDGKNFGVNISYFKETEPLGTAGALFHLGLNEDFLLCNGDLIFDFRLDKMINYHNEKKALATLLTHPNTHPYDSTLIVASENGCVTDLIQKSEKPFAYSNLCNAGIQIISPKLLELFTITGKANLDRDIIKPAVKTGRVYSYKTPEYVKDMGTPERLAETQYDIKTGFVQRKNLSNLKKAVFLDRDGTINIHKGYITAPADMELLPGVAEAIKHFNELGYLVIVVTNQPVIARGDCTIETLSQIHNRMETLLGEKGAYVDAIYYCPHHPESGFENEIKELKITCECRKPHPGLLLQAKEDFNIDMSKSFMVGDSSRDIEAGKNAECTPICISESETYAEDKNVKAYKSLLNFSKTLTD